MLITTAQAAGNLAATSRPRPRSAAAPRDDATEETSPDQRVHQVRAADALRETHDENYLPPGSFVDIRA